MSIMWTHNGAWHRLAAADLTIAVLEPNPPAFDLMTDVEASCSGARWSGTFMAPEHIRDCLTRWAATGEAKPGNEFCVPDGVIVADVNLEVIETVVRAHLQGDGSLRGHRSSGCQAISNARSCRKPSDRVVASLPQPSETAGSVIDRLTRAPRRPSRRHVQTSTNGITDKEGTV